MSDDKDKDKDKGNLIAFTGGATPNVDAESLRQFKANIAIILEYQETTALMTRHKYLALIKQGFEEKQALELCKTLP